MSLLTPTDSHAYHPFYNHMDAGYHHSQHMTHEWPIHHGSNELAADIDLHGSEALAKATKELMALEPDHQWAESSNARMQDQGLHYNYFPQQGQHDQQQHYSRYDLQPRQYQPRQQPRRNITFPFLAKQEQPTASSSHPPLSINPSIAMDIQQQQGPNYVPTPTTASSSSNSSSYGFQSSPMLTSPTSPVHPVRLSRSPGLTPPVTHTTIKRRSFDSAILGPHKRSRLSPPLSAHPYSRPSTSPTPPISSKPPLLSPDQKKANHIQSEQKRRANIRRGYEALCETVPALREAIRAEEEALANGKEKGSRSRRKAKKEDGAAEKIDGRAGPRSENVVLVKTIDYINDLHAERSDLFSRLERAKSLLGDGHPALVRPDSTPALWEREWKGGAGSEGEEDEDSE